MLQYFEYLSAFYKAHLEYMVISGEIRPQKGELTRTPYSMVESYPHDIVGKSVPSPSEVLHQIVYFLCHKFLVLSIKFK
jgi:hypothetical protein